MRVPYIAALALALALAGCGAAPDAEADAAAASGAPAASADRAREASAPTATNISLPSQQEPRAVIRNAALGVRVQDLEKAERDAAGLVRSLRGYIESAESTDLAGKHPTLTMRLRVPESAFDSALQSFEALGTRLSKRIEAKDVTAKIADHAARLETMRAHEQALREMLRAAKDANSIYEAQRRLADVRGEIEGLQAQLKAVRGLASLSSIELTLSQSAEAAPASDPRWAAEAWAAASASAGGAFRSAAGVAMWLVAYSPLWAIGLVAWRMLARRRTQRITASP